MSKRKPKPLQRSARVLAGPALRPALLRVADGRIMGSGNIVFPCVPALVATYVEKLAALWTLLGRPFAETERSELQASVERLVAMGFEHSPHTLLVINYEAHPPPKANLTYSMLLKERSVESYYAEWSKKDGGAWFGAAADAKVLALAGQLAPGARVLDVGAGHGRNALALAQRGLAVDALELVPALCERMRESARSASLPVNVIEQDIFDHDLELPQASYALVILCEVVSHFRTPQQLRDALSTLMRALAPDGLLLMNAFLPEPGYLPDRLVRELAQVALSSVFTHGELAAATAEVGLEQLCDESAYAYEREHLPAGAWPPTKWFESWASGGNLFGLAAGQSPIALRWLVYRKSQLPPGPLT